ncbi:MAG: alpha-galactosidase, partial [Lachnospiraceae bacterium]|nr:alpha-galactosidase [Lachnospiraceae bacterium]
PYATGDHGTGEDGAFKESRAGRMIRALTFLRELCGQKLILGCGTPVMPAFGLVDYCRIGCDVGLDWNDKMYMRIIHRERVSTKQSINNTIFRSGLDRRAHGNDPDVFFLRDNNISLTPAEKNYLATVNALFGSVWLTSDDLNSYDGAKIAQYRALVHMREAATDVSIDHDTLTVSYTLDGKRHKVEYPHRYKVK